MTHTFRRGSDALVAPGDAFGVPSELHGRVLDALGQAVVATDMSGRLVYCNRAAAALYGLRPDDEAADVTATMRAAVTLDDRDELQVSLRAGEPWTGEVSLRTPTGREVPVLMTVTPVHEDGITTHVVTMAIDLTDRKAAEARLERQALHDSLTGLPNRTLFHARLTDAVARATRGHGRVGVLYIDLDDFKLINDLYGHAAGDEVLRAVGNLLEAATRRGDIVARIGGDEFGVVCEPIRDEEEAIAASQRLVSALDIPFGVRSHEIHISTSIGIAVSRQHVDANELLQDADIALYRAKELGRARAVLFDDDLKARSHRRVQLEEALRGALGAGELSLHYQPEVEISTGRLVGFEALMRWNHPVLGSVPPEEFIPVAERSEVIHEIGRWALEVASLEAAAWQRQHPELEVKVAVNLSAKQLGDSRIVDHVRDALDRSRLSPHRLCLEITETVVMDDARASAGMLHELKSLGIELSIDDQAIVASVVDLGRSLGLHVVAEGVENTRQLAVLEELGCAQGQGFLWSYPLPSVEVPRVLDLAALEGVRTR